jgi:carbon storage regulator CsrA
LTLSRKKNERIVIGDAVVTVIEISPDRVRLGVDGPRDVYIGRGELRDAVERRVASGQVAHLETTSSANVPLEIADSLKHFREDHPDPGKVAFIMMRFGSTSAHNSIVEGIRLTLQPLGIAAVRADEKEYHPDLWLNVFTYIYGCSFGIAVFDRLEADEFNPNVSLEVGHLYGLGKPVCLLKDKTLKTLHTDLVGKLYRPFDPQDPKTTIPTELSKWIKDKGIIASP